MRQLRVENVCEISQALQKIDVQGFVTSVLFIYNDKQTDRQTITTHSQERSIPDALVPFESKNERLSSDQTEYIHTFPGGHVCLFNFQSDGRTLQSGFCLCERRHAGWEDKG